MPLKPNEAGRLRGMIARLITTKATVERLSAQEDFTGSQVANGARAVTDYRKAKEKLNNYIDSLEESKMRPISSDADG